MSVNKISTKNTSDISKIIDSDIGSFSSISDYEIDQVSIARFDPNKADSTMAVEENGTTIYSTGNTWRSIVTDIGMNTGKIYFEAEWISSVSNYSAIFGICNGDFDWTLYHPLANANVIAWKTNTTSLYIQGTANSGLVQWGEVCTVGMAVDIPNKLVWCMKDGVWYFGNPSTGTGGKSFTLNTPLYIWGNIYWANDYNYYHFENWNYTPPTGFGSPTSALV